MTNKEIYRKLSEQADMPLFMQYWWLEGVSAGKDWDVILITDADAEDNVPASDGKATADTAVAPASSSETADPQENSKEAPEEEPMPTVLAAMPYEVSKKFWLRHVNQPVLCPYGGVWFNPSVADDADKVAALYKRIDAKLSELRLMSYNQLFRPDCPSVHILDGLGFKFVTRGTYVLNDLSNLQRVIDGFSRGKRKKLEKLTLTYSVEDIEPEAFFYFHHFTLSQKKDKPTYSRETLLVMAEKAAERNQIRIFGVRNQDKDLLAAAVVVWDAHYAYLLLDTFDHDLPDSGARELLTLEALKIAHDRHLKFDFARHRSYLKNYGAKKTTFYSVHKGAAVYVMMQRFIEWCKH